MSHILALVGNPNAGKTTLFNQLTGSSQYVGNWPGVTVEKKFGRIQGLDEQVDLVDLPGIYSLSPYSLEEVIARNFLVKEKPDVIINIVDVSNLERNLYLTMQLLELKWPTVIALNMMDVVEKNGDSIDVAGLAKLLGVPIVPVTASKGKGMEELLTIALDLAHNPQEHQDIDFYPTCFHQGIEELALIIADQAKKLSLEPEWAAIKLLEKDELLLQEIKLKAEEAQLAQVKINEITEFYHYDGEITMADMRYHAIDLLLQKVYHRKLKIGEKSLSDKIDALVTNKYLAIPFFLGVMALMFQLTFSSIGTFLTDNLDIIFNVKLAEMVEQLLNNLQVNYLVIDLIVHGIIAGMSSVLGFLPQIIMLFLFLALLEDSGYMARAAFIMDKLLRKIGLNGKSFIPMLVGFGCSVPAIMATRTLENESDRKMTIMLSPFMSCGARLPIYALFAGAFFAQHKSLVILSMYLLGIIIAILVGLILRKTLFKGEPSTFVMEMPPYRMPSLKSLSTHVWDRSKDFVIRAGTLIFAASVIIWIFQTFRLDMNVAVNQNESIFAVLGTGISPIFAPLGFGDWRASVAIITGLVAKEAVVSTAGILYGSLTNIQAAFTPLSAYALMAFTLLYSPCIAAIAAMKRELNSWKWTVFAVMMQTGTAWLVAFLIYQGGKLLGLR
ncbi:MAG: ferrous iron transport protein B [Clostridia bacterium]